MIYNPNIYDETLSKNDTLYTGNFAQYIEAVTFRADGAAKKPKYVPRPVSDMMKIVPKNKVDFGGSRGDRFITPYKVGSKHDFYSGSGERTLRTFVCRYAGESCNVWTHGNVMSDSEAKAYGNEFDKKIFKPMTKMFGKGRFVDNGGKVNFLFYEFDPGYGGFFHGYDLYSADELSPAQIKEFRINTDHAILHINSLYKNDTQYIYGTLAHEYQHLICFTNYFSTANKVAVKSWLNEGMSTYVEEKLYPGAMDHGGKYDQFVKSQRIRHGQSMYNFGASYDLSNLDVGVYGSVYLFSEYLSKLSGDDVFSKIHSYWRNSYSKTLDEAEAIVESIPKSVYNKIDSSFDFGDKVKVLDDDELWLSKLTLNFYLSLLNYDKSDPEAFKKVKSQALLYDEINPADIEGGGRVIVALKDGKYEIPPDADYGFIYMGLDKEFNVVTDFVVQ